jgi:hypothetical protein
MGTKHQVSELTGEKLEAATYLAIMSGDRPAMTVVEQAGNPPEKRYYATRDPDSFDGQHGATKREAVLRLFVFEAFGDEVQL